MNGEKNFGKDEKNRQAEREMDRQRDEFISQLEVYNGRTPEHLKTREERSGFWRGYADGARREVRRIAFDWNNKYDREGDIGGVRPPDPPSHSVCQANWDKDAYDKAFITGSAAGEAGMRALAIENGIPIHDIYAEDIK